jgi:hypothetical protein
MELAHVQEYQDPVQLRSARHEGGDPCGVAQFVRKLSGFNAPSKANERAPPTRP